MYYVKMNYIVTLYMSILVFNTVSDWHLSSTLMTWEESIESRQCKLTDTEKDVQELDQQTTDAINMEVEVPQRVWVGAYVQYSPWFNLTGCYYGIFNGQEIDISSTVDPVYVCYNHCNGSFLLTYTNCICKRFEQVLTSSGCKGVKCNNKSKGVCGNGTVIQGEKEYNCMCNYKIEHDFNSTGNGNCVTVKRKENKSLELKTNHCSERHAVLCVDIKNRNPKSLNKSASWERSALACYKENVNYVSDPSLTPVSSFSITYWIGIFRTFNLKWGSPGNDVSLSDCVAKDLTKCNGKESYALLPCDRQLYALCTSKVSSTPRTVILTQNSTPTNKTMISQSIYSTNNRLQNTTITTDIDGSQTENSNQKKITLYIILGTVCGIVVAFVGIACIVVFRKYQKSPSNNPEPEENPPSYEELNVLDREPSPYTAVINTTHTSCTASNIYDDLDKN